MNLIQWNVRWNESINIYNQNLKMNGKHRIVLDSDRDNLNIYYQVSLIKLWHLDACLAKIFSVDYFLLCARY